MNDKSPSKSPLLPGGGYVRFSSQMQEDGFSLEAQERQIRQRARQDGVEIVALFSDPAHSAYRKKHRPGIGEMLAAARRGAFKFLYVHKLDRLARRLEWSLEILKELEECGVTLRAVEQNINLSTPDGKLMFHLLSSLGEFYSDNLSQETHKGKHERAMQGYHNGWVSWGYLSEMVNGRKQAVPDPKRAPIVREMFAYYATGLYSDRQVADWLNAQGCQTQRGRLFSKDTVREMLRNPFYVGFIRYRGHFVKGQAYRAKQDLIKGVHTPLLEQALFDQCQQVRASRRRKVKTRQITRRVYLLNGIIVCTYCGRGLRAQSSVKGPRYYREVSRQNGFGDCPHAGTSIRAELAEAQIARLVQALTLPKGWQAALQELLKGEARRPDPAQKRSRLKADLRRLRENYELGLYADDFHVYRRKVEALKEQLEALKFTPPAEVGRAAQVLLSLQEAWQVATLEEQRELVQMMLASVACDLATKQVTHFTPRVDFALLFQLLLPRQESKVYPFPPYLLKAE